MTKLKQFRPTMFLKQDISKQTMYKHSALFDPIRDEPEFIELLKEYRDNAAEQRRLVQADEAK